MLRILMELAAGLGLMLGAIVVAGVLFWLSALAEKWVRRWPCLAWTRSERAAKVREYAFSVFAVCLLLVTFWSLGHDALDRH